jgi:hypothetical protein
MNPSFTTPEAQERWDAIPPHYQEQILHNVWCPHCRDMMTTIPVVPIVPLEDFNLTVWDRWDTWDIEKRGIMIRCVQNMFERILLNGDGLG